MWTCGRETENKLETTTDFEGLLKRLARVPNKELDGDGREHQAQWKRLSEKRAGKLKP